MEIPKNFRIKYHGVMKQIATSFRTATATATVFNLLRNSRTQHLRPEERTLRLLDHSLVYTLRRVIHDHRAGLVVDLGVDLGVSDQVDDPLLAF